MRYLDDREDEVPGLTKRKDEYHQLRATHNRFGSWLRWKHLGDFDRAYCGWWLKHPELFDNNQPQEAHATHP